MMKRWLAALLLCGPPTGFAQESLDQVMRLLAAVPAVEGDFREEKHLAALREPLVATGRLYYRAPSFLRKQTLFPQAEDYEADGDWLTVETPAAGRRQFDLNGYPQLRPLVEAIRATQAGDRKTLERFYRLEFAGAPASWSLRLTPLDPEAARYVTAIILRGQEARIASVETLEAGGDRGVLTLVPR